jgi:hypothetical protein
LLPQARSLQFGLQRFFFFFFLRLASAVGNPMAAIGPTAASPATTPTTRRREGNARKDRDGKWAGRHLYSSQ